jgi:hypothetical protein
LRRYTEGVSGGGDGGGADSMYNQPISRGGGGSGSGSGGGSRKKSDLNMSSGRGGALSSALFNPLPENAG